MNGSLIRSKECPSQDAWLSEAKADKTAALIGMYLTHTGIVRSTSKASAREGKTDTPPVTGMLFSYDPEKAEAAIADALMLPGIYYIRVWMNSGRLELGDTIMQVMVGGDIRPHVIDGLQQLVGKLKSECVTETEVY